MLELGKYSRVYRSPAGAWVPFRKPIRERCIVQVSQLRDLHTSASHKYILKSPEVLVVKKKRSWVSVLVNFSISGSSMYASYRFESRGGIWM